MMEAGYDSNMVFEGTAGQTPLIYSAYNGNAETTDILLKKQADPLYKDEKGMNAFFAAADSNNISVMSLLLSKGVNIEQRNDVGNTALMHAAEKGNLKAVRLLAEKNANINTKNYNGETALSLATNHEHNDTVGFLVSRGAKIDKKTASKIITRSIENEDTDLLKSVLETYPNLIDERNSAGRTPLILAVLADNANAVKFLISKGADINLADDFNGLTPISYAAREGIEYIFFTLLDAGADPNKKSYEGVSAISMSMAPRNPNILNALIKKKANVNEASITHGMTVLMSYVIDVGFGDNKPNEEILDILLKNKVDINAQDVNGKTALMIATLYDNSSFIKKLLKYRPNINLKDNEGHSLIYHIVTSKMLFGGDLDEAVLVYSKKYNNAANHFAIEMEYLETLADSKMTGLDDRIRKLYTMKGYPSVAIDNEVQKARAELVSNLAQLIANEYSYKHAVEYVHSQKENLFYSDYVKIAKEFELNDLTHQVLTNPKKFKKADGSLNESLIKKMTPNATPFERMQASSSLRNR